jgi:hypothetical protein
MLNKPGAPAMNVQPHGGKHENDAKLSFSWRNTLFHDLISRARGWVQLTLHTI